MSVYLRGATIPSVATVSLEQSPSGLALASASARPTRFSYGFVDFTFSAPVGLTAGASYNLVATVALGSHEWGRVTTPDLYPFGSAGRRTDAGEVTPLEGDFLFRVWGCPTVALTPTATSTLTRIPVTPSIVVPPGIVVPPSTVTPTAIQLPTITATPPALAPLPTPLAPQPQRPAQLWLEVLAATMTVSAEGEALWEAQPGEWYRVLAQEADWVLAAWELDPPEAAVWIQIDGRVALVLP